jgi:cytochrome P450
MIGRDMTTMVDIDTFDPRSAAYLADPYGHLACLRADTPVVHHAASGHWFLLRYDDVASGLADIARNTDLSPGRHDRRPDFADNPFAADGSAHTGPRRLITPTFTNRALQRFRARAEHVVDGALAGKRDGSELRVVDEIGYPLPYLLTCEVLGVPEVGNVDELRDWTWKSLALLDVFLTPEEVAANSEAARCLAAHIGEVVAWKRDHLGDDVASTIIAAGDDGTVMAPGQVVPYLHTLYLAGMHTTVNQTALSLRALLDQRPQWDLLVAHPELIENAVEELLRFEPTAQYMLRTTYADFTFGDTVIPRQSDVVCWIASANRDPGQWGATADTLDITRSDARYHVAFGKGAHTCLGSWLARLELQVVLERITGRFPRTELPDQELVWSSDVIRGPDELVLVLRS